MNCKYSYQEKEQNGRHYLLCNKMNGQKCPIVRYCPKVGDIINTDNYDKNCKIYIDVESNIGKSSNTPNKVLFPKRNKLWIKTGDEDCQVVVLDNPFDYVPSFVKLLKRQNGEYYIKVPKQNKK